MIHYNIKRESPASTIDIGDIVLVPFPGEYATVKHVIRTDDIVYISSNLGVYGFPQSEIVEIFEQIHTATRASEVDNGTYEFVQRIAKERGRAD